MRTLIVGIGALGGLIAARLHAAGTPAHLATRTAESAAALRAAGLRVTGVGGDASADASLAAPLDEHLARGPFDLIILATKAHDAIETAPRVAGLLAPGGSLLPIQNGGVSQMLADRLGAARVLGGISNLGATMHAPGVYEQRNAGHMLIGELAPIAGDCGASRADRVQRWLGRAVEVRTTPNMRGAIWSKLLLNCSVTTLGAIAGRTMRGYIDLPGARELFTRTYDEALAVASAAGATPQRMLVDPIPPAWDPRERRTPPGPEHDAWLAGIMAAYGDLKPSMLQDFERRRPTEIDFINGYVANLGRERGLSTPINAAIVETVHAITRGDSAPNPENLRRLLDASSR